MFGCSRENELNEKFESTNHLIMEEKATNSNFTLESILEIKSTLYENAQT